MGRETGEWAREGVRRVRIAYLPPSTYKKEELGSILTVWACVSLHCVFIVEQFVNLADQLDQSGEKSCGAGQSTNYRDASGVYDVFYTDQTGRCLLPCWLLAFLAEGGSILFSLSQNLFFLKIL
jgi:hypothetical protein